MQNSIQQIYAEKARGVVSKLRQVLPKPFTAAKKGILDSIKNKVSTRETSHVTIYQ
jgi:hypothetical protein